MLSLENLSASTTLKKLKQVFIYFYLRQRLRFLLPFIQDVANYRKEYRNSGCLFMYILLDYPASYIHAGEVD